MTLSYLSHSLLWYFILNVSLSQFKLSLSNAWYQNPYEYEIPNFTIALWKVLSVNRQWNTRTLLNKKIVPSSFWIDSTTTATTTTATTVARFLRCFLLNDWSFLGSKKLFYQKTMRRSCSAKMWNKMYIEVLFCFELLGQDQVSIL